MKFSKFAAIACIGHRKDTDAKKEQVRKRHSVTVKFSMHHFADLSRQEGCFDFGAWREQTAST